MYVGMLLYTSLVKSFHILIARRIQWKNLSTVWISTIVNEQRRPRRHVLHILSLETLMEVASLLRRSTM